MTTEKKTIAEQFPWAVVGAEAYIYASGTWGGVATLTHTTILKVTKSRVTVKGWQDRTFYVPMRRDALYEMGRDVWRSPELIAVDDPRVEEAREAGLKKAIENTAKGACEAFMRDKGLENAHKAVAALLDYIEANKEEQN